MLNDVWSLNRPEFVWQKMCIVGAPQIGSGCTRNHNINIESSKEYDQYKESKTVYVSSLKKSNYNYIFPYHN